MRLKLKRGRRPWSLFLYDSVESAFYLRDSVRPDPTLGEYRREIVFGPDDVVEVEWVGSEWVYDDEVDPDAVDPLRNVRLVAERYDRVFIGKLTRRELVSHETDAAAPDTLELYAGWVVNGVIPWAGGGRRDAVRITPIKGVSKPKFDFSLLLPALTADNEENGVGEIEGPTEALN